MDRLSRLDTSEISEMTDGFDTSGMSFKYWKKKKFPNIEFYTLRKYLSKMEV